MIFCTVCGAQLDDGAKFCTSCGNPVETKVAEEYTPQPEQPVYTEPVAPEPAYTQPVYTQSAEQPAAMDKNALILAIIGLALSCAIFTSLIGFILSLVAKGKVKKLSQPLTGGNKVAGILSTLGIVFGIIGMIVAVIYFFIWIGALISGGAAMGSSIDWSDVFSVIG
jgi:hypothetical protein